MDSNTAFAGSEQVEQQHCLAAGDGNSGPNGGGNEPTAQSDPADFPWRETTVFYALGIRSRDEMRAMRRHLTEGVHWCRSGLRVLYSEKGRARIAQDVLKGANGPQTPSTPEKSQDGAIPPIVPPKKTVIAPAPEPNPVKTLVVVSVPKANRHVVECRLPDADPLDRTQRCIVRVRDNTNFLPGSETGTVLARLVHGTLYDFVGNPNHPETPFPRCPRFRGRW